jgi:hypothetical protein
VISDLRESFQSNRFRAMCSGVSPFISLEFTSAPKEIRKLIILCELQKQAQCSGVLLS